MTIKVDIQRDPVISLRARRSLNGDIMIFDHEDLDIVLGANSKCIAFPKAQTSDKVYQAQSRMFEFLAKRGVVDRASIRGGNVYGALEANIMESKIPGVDNVQAFLYALDEYINEEKPFFRSSKSFNDDRLDYLLRPDDDDSTDLGDVPQSAKKGSLHPGIRPYGFMYNYSLVREHKEKQEQEEE